MDKKVLRGNISSKEGFWLDPPNRTRVIRHLLGKWSGMRKLTIDKDIEGKRVWINRCRRNLAKIGQCRQEQEAQKPGIVKKELSGT